MNSAVLMLLTVLVPGQPPVVSEVGFSSLDACHVVAGEYQKWATYLVQEDADRARLNKAIFPNVTSGVPVKTQFVTVCAVR